MAQILTPQQELALEAISQSNLAKQFYFSGGTALSHYYLQHRLSEDLDFFCLFEVDKYLDDPILLAEFDRQKLSDFFQQEAQSMRTKILEN